MARLWFRQRENIAETGNASQAPPTPTNNVNDALHLYGAFHDTQGTLHQNHSTFTPQSHTGGKLHVSPQLPWDRLDGCVVADLRQRPLRPPSSIHSVSVGEEIETNC